jgi:hypothetical protein
MKSRLPPALLTELLLRFRKDGKDISIVLLEIEDKPQLTLQDDPGKACKQRCGIIDQLAASLLMDQLHRLTAIRLSLCAIKPQVLLRKVPRERFVTRLAVCVGKKSFGCPFC